MHLHRRERHHAGLPRNLFAAAPVIEALLASSNRSSSGISQGANEKSAFSVRFVSSSYHEARLRTSPSAFSISSLGSSSAIWTVFLP